MGTVTLFVDNLPEAIHWKGLWHVVGRQGEEHSVFIARKRSRAGTRFSFVRVGNEMEAARIIERLNGLKIFGKRISVKLAKYSIRDSKEKSVRRKMVWNPKKGCFYAGGESPRGD
ncbi:serine/arginine-rich splicing factor SC35-like [Hibiscus syriacus]|uniref:serine/arginine-rich splicing factor SC35-like n=1 Tax=Hibiscus syriacus TaxID=106335 RepID=UPI0019232522|nr:serine/arginine-rich splicing factor SC35-like [Hibiscus syriacus]